MTFIIFLNPEWQESDGGKYKIFNNYLSNSKLIDVVDPTLGKALIARSDKVWHNAQQVYTEKRALTLFVLLKPLDLFNS